MRVHLGAGWTIWHLTERVVELRKDDHAYRRFTGRDGYVRFRVEPGTNRDALLTGALVQAMRQDELLAERVARQLLPAGRALERYRAEQRRLALAFGTPEDEARIGRKRA